MPQLCTNFHNKSNNTDHTIGSPNTSYIPKLQQQVPRMPQQTGQPWSASCMPAVPQTLPSEVRQRNKNSARENAPSWPMDLPILFSTSTSCRPVPQAQKSLWPDSEARQLIILQRNCDYLPTKVGELTELARNQAVDLILLQETKLGCGDPTPRIPGYECLRLDRPGCVSTLRRGGRLATYIRDNIPYNLMGATTSGPLE